MSAPAGPPTVVCLHGLGRTPGDWDGVRCGLEALGDVRAPHLPPVPADALAAAGEAIPDGALVIAHSIGGVLALRLAHERGRRYRALVLTDAFFPPARNGRGTLASVGDYLGHRVAFLRAARSRPAPEPEAGPHSDPAAGPPFDRAASPSHQGRAAALRGLARLGLRRADFDAAAASVSAPVLVVHARDDHHVPIDFALAAAARHSGWQFEALPRGGHHAHVTEPCVWLEAVLPWLEARSLSRRGVPG